jgi:large subunit ribosomal protein L29
MKTKELREKNAEELKTLLSQKREAVRKLRFDISTKQVQNNKQLLKDKKDIARILTLINESNTHGQGKK